MAKSNTKNRGFSSRELRKLRIEMFQKTFNRKANLVGCTEKNIRINAKLKSQGV